jgi:hypothetical protein
METPICPRCGKNDAVEPIQNAYRRGSNVLFRSVSRVLPNGLSTLYWIGQTELSRQLSLPPAPSRANFAWVIIPAIIGGYFVWLSLSEFPHFYFTLFLIGLVPLTIAAHAVVTRNEQMPQIRRWREAKRRWHRLYYCVRNQCVIDPETNDCVPIADKDTLLFGNH